jgi:hypothetical protein
MQLAREVAPGLTSILAGAARERSEAEESIKEAESRCS